MIDMNGNNDLFLGTQLRRSEGEQVSDWLRMENTSSTSESTGDANTYIKSRLATLGLLDRKEERKLAQNLEHHAQQMALLAFGCPRSASELLAIIDCAVGGELRKNMLSTEERFFVLRREMDDLAKAPGNADKLKHLMAYSEQLCRPDWQLSPAVVALITTLDWPRPLMFSLAGRVTAAGRGSSVLQQAVGEYLHRYTDTGKRVNAISDAHKGQFGYFCRAYLRERETLVNHNLRLVFHIAKRYAHKNEYLPDLIQEGTFGLIRAAEKYRVASGFRFSTYAHHWIDSKVRKARVNIDRVMNVSHDYNIELLRISQCLEQHNARGSKPSPTELAKEVNISKEKLDAVLQLRQFGVSLDEPLGEEEGLSLHAKLADANADFVTQIMNQRYAEHLNSVMDRLLTQREAYIVNERFGRIGDPRTLQELSDILGISRERVRQLETGALKKLSSCIDRDSLSP